MSKLAECAKNQLHWLNFAGLRKPELATKRLEGYFLKKRFGLLLQQNEQGGF